MDFQPGDYQWHRGDEAGSGDDRRSEARHSGLIDSATLLFRNELHHVPVLNISSRGTMIESALEPRLGESVEIRFAGCSPLYAFVRWRRDGRIGLSFGCEMILRGAA